MYRLFRIPFPVLLASFVCGLAVFFAGRWTYLANYDIFFDGSSVHLMRGFGVYLATIMGLLLTLFGVVGWLTFYAIPWIWLVHKNGWRVGALIYKRERCDHHWVYDPHNSAKRTCSKCQSYQTLAFKRFVEAGEASLNWRDQNFDELRFL